MLVYSTSLAVASNQIKQNIEKAGMSGLFLWSEFFISFNELAVYC